MTSNPHAERDATIDALVARAKRRSQSVPIRVSFVQHGPQGAPVPGPLAALVRNHDERGLDLYLALRLAASSSALTGDFDVRLAGKVWAYALGLPTTTDDGAVAVSKTWSRLDKHHNLVSRHRSGNFSEVRVLDEAGNRDPYVYPNGRGDSRYFKLSEAFWSDGRRLYRSLSLAAKATLLIASSLKPGFPLPELQVSKWYGISKETFVKGRSELESEGLLKVVKQTRAEPLSPQRYVVEHRYTLLAPLAQDRRTTLASVTHLPAQGTAVP